MYDELFERLSKSKFRSKFRLREKDIAYIKQKGLDTIKRHAIDFIAKRISPSFIPNDGKQTPMKNHPVFVAQHATACCCRKCINKWHHFPMNIKLTAEQQEYLVNIIMYWIELEIQNK